MTLPTKEKFDNFVGNWILQNGEKAVVEFTSDITGWSIGYILINSTRVFLYWDDKGLAYKDKLFEVNNDCNLFKRFYLNKSKDSNSIEEFPPETILQEPTIKGIPNPYKCIQDSHVFSDLKDWCDCGKLKRVEVFSTSIEQPLPQISKLNIPPIYSLVIADMVSRAEQGKLKYGRYLEAGNGRDGLIDLYEELLDASQYVRQVIEEDKAKNSCYIGLTGIDLYRKYLMIFKNPFPIKWEDLPELSQIRWDNLANFLRA